MKKRLFIVVFVALLMVGCIFQAAKPDGVTDAEWNLMQFQSIYTAQHRDATAMAKNPNITPEQAQVVRTKVAVLSQARPLINAYALAVNNGAPVDPKQEQQIYDLLTSIGGQIQRRAAK